MVCISKMFYEHSKNKKTVILKNSQNAVHFFGQQQQLLLVSVKNEKQFFNFIFLAERHIIPSQLSLM